MPKRRRKPVKTSAIGLDCPKCYAIPGNLCNNESAGIHFCKERHNLAISLSRRTKPYKSPISESDLRKLNNKRDRAQWLSWKLRRCYGLTPAEFEAMKTEQHNQCAICHGSLDNSHIDHDHVTNKIRGILCGMCNVAIGYFRDNHEVMLRAATYIINKGFRYVTVKERFVPDPVYLAKINQGGSLGRSNKGTSLGRFKRGAGNKRKKTRKTRMHAWEEYTDV
jgi:hypothetical protein